MIQRQSAKEGIYFVKSDSPFETVIVGISAKTFSKCFLCAERLSGVAF